MYSNSDGGDPEAAVEAALLAVTSGAIDVEFYGKSADDSGLFNLTGMGGNSGTWATVAQVGIDYITVYAANSFALDDVGGAVSGSWSTLGILSNGGSRPNVSHISFWTADVAPVPLPTAGWLMLAAFGSLAAVKRRQS